MTKRIIGIDVSKNSLDYLCLPEKNAGKAKNNPEGITKLLTCFKALQPQLVVLEATGGYQQAVVKALHENAVPVKVVNPRQVRDFARSLNRLGKTDSLDAETLAQFGLSRELKPTSPKSEDLERISALLLRREQLQLMLTAERGHLEHMPEPLASDIREHIAQLRGFLKVLDGEIRARIKANPTYAEHDAIVQSVPGFGPVVAATLLAELPEITVLGRKQVAALVGVAPFNRDSGKFRGQRHIAGGRTKVRNVLYCAMRACLRWNAVVRGWFDAFRACGKPYKVAVIACIRKLLNVVRAMLITGKRWNQDIVIR